MPMPLKDFKQLKALKASFQDSEKRDSHFGGSCNQHRRSRVLRETVNLEQTRMKRLSQQTGIEAGMRVRMLDSELCGVVVEITEQGIVMQTQGISVPVAYGDFVVENPMEQELLLGSVPPALDYSSSDETCSLSRKVDLHLERILGHETVVRGHELEFQMEYFRRELRRRLPHRGMRIEFVHGVGDSVLRDCVRHELDTVFPMSCTWTSSHAGVTVVTVK